MAKKTKQEAQQERLSLAEKRNRQERRNKKSRKEREQEKRRKKQERDRRKQKNIPTTAQQSIPYIRMLQDGICQVTKTFFSKTIQFYDINYQLALNEDKTTIFENYCDFLNYFDSSISVQLSFINQQVDVAEFEKSIDIPDQNDDFNAIREEYRTMLKNQLSKIDIGTGNGGIISQLKMQNEMKLTDESWISYQQGKGNEEYQKYMEDLTDMQNHVLPYLQSFCSLEEKGVKERREQQVAEKNESREAVPRAGVEINTAVKDAGKAERKAVAQKKTMPEKEKKPSIHERLEINKRIIQEKQGKDKPERGADLGVRTV